MATRYPVSVRVVALVVLVACTHQPSPSISGVVAVEQFTSDRGASSDVRAMFGVAPNGTFVEDLHGCSLYLDPPTDSALSVGEIDINGTLEPIALKPSGIAPHISYLNPQGLPDPMFVGDATISFYIAGGGDIEEFDGTIAAPATTLPGYQPPATPLSRSGIHVAWTPSGLPIVEILLVASSSTTQDAAIIDCLIDDIIDTGTGDIPASLLAKIPAACDSAVLGVGAFWNVSRPVVGGNTSVEVVLRSLANTSVLPLVQ